MVAESNGLASGPAEILPAVPRLSDDNLRSIVSFDDALALVNDVLGGEVIAADEEIGNGFSIINDKSVLIGVPMIMLSATRNVSDKGDKGYFYSLTCVTKMGGKVVINDGSTGIAEQLETLYSRHPEKRGVPMLLRKGLRRSDYTTLVNGKEASATTFYLDTSGE